MGTFQRDFLNQIIGRGKTQPKCGQHLLVAAQTKGHGRKSVCFACLPHSLGKFIDFYCHCIPLLILE